MRIRQIMFILSIAILITVIQSIFIPSISQADDSLEKVIKSGDEFVSGGEILIDKTKLNEKQSFIFNSLLSVGIVLTVIIGGFLGIKFMLASAEDKAEIKQMLIPYVVGCIVVYGAFGIWKLIITILDQMT